MALGFRRCLAPTLLCVLGQLETLMLSDRPSDTGTAPSAHR